MTTALTIADYLKYVNLQMAAEAFLADSTGTLKDDLNRALIEGNFYASRFTQTQATEFLDANTGWTVVAQKPNTETGFSGTLFRNNETGELVLSFRSTEFVRDAIRDSAATNTLEIKNTGWAWGQIADMEAWYDKLSAPGGPLFGQTYSVTGYSLGGHLATAFNLLRQEELAQGPQTATLANVVTFNGAGVGQIKNGGTVSDALAYFNDLRGNALRIEAELKLTVPALVRYYAELRFNLDANIWTETQALDALQALTIPEATGESPTAQLFAAEKKPIEQALQEIIALQAERSRINGFKSGGTDPDADKTLATLLPSVGQTEAETLDYRLAVILAGMRTNGSNLVIDGLSALGDKEPGEPQMSNQWDLVGNETASVAWSAVAHSLWHHGTDVDVFIEDQPFKRGNMGIVDLVSQEFLKDGFANNNFSDTHSLVLIVDSLAVQSTIANLLTDTARTDSGLLSKFTEIFNAASWRRKEETSGTQGKAEGDVLENILNALADMTLGIGQGPTLGIGQDTKRLKGNPDGNTWAEISGTNGYTGRSEFYALLKAIQESPAFITLGGSLKIENVDTSAVRSNFGQFMALATLSPFALVPAEGTSQEVFESSFGAEWREVYTDWATDRDERAVGPVLTAPRISGAWYADRTEFLTRKNWFNTQNINPENPNYNYSEELEKLTAMTRTSSTVPIPSLKIRTKASTRFKSQRPIRSGPLLKTWSLRAMPPSTGPAMLLTIF